METRIFFSWQADRSTKVGRNLLERSLEQAIKAINEPVSVEEPDRDDSNVMLDRDTKDTPGFPPIVETIFSKIERAAVFVPDFTFVGTRADGRPTPNPNVLIEYGYALKTLGHSRIIPVMNIAYGEPNNENLPFDLRHHRHPITFNCPETASESDRQSVRGSLSKVLGDAILAVLRSASYRSALPADDLPKLFASRPESGIRGRLFPERAAIGVAEFFPGLGHNSPVVLGQGSAMWLRVMPKYDQNKTWTRSDLHGAITVSSEHLGLLIGGYGGFSYFNGTDSRGIFVGTPGGIAPSVTSLFYSGEIWSIDVAYLDSPSGPRTKVVPYVENIFANALSHYANVLTRLGVTGELHWSAGIDGIKDRQLAVPAQPGASSHFHPRGTFLANEVCAEGDFLTGGDAKVALTPFFEKIYDGACLSRQW
ncbi:hypothetical protein [Paraburkholderia sp. BCC1876]|uniref:hypothetical protein n=1 Tax=Paraburkholderia sp. BCC1876 TaxID=2676303 RepID=UPI0015920ACE|nr:hypothetical protein [Paraburkholderia sp. BCC1876]